MLLHISLSGQVAMARSVSTILSISLPNNMPHLMIEGYESDPAHVAVLVRGNSDPPKKNV